MTLNAEVVSGTSKKGNAYKCLEIEIAPGVKMRVFPSDAELSLIEIQQ